MKYKKEEESTMIYSENEKIEDLGDGFRIIQDKTKFCYGTDAVVLAEFIVAKPKEKVIDLCSGTAIIPILLCKYSRCFNFIALEIQKEMCDIARRSVTLNHLEDKIQVLCHDLKKVKEIYSSGAFDVVSCNPPYMIKGTGKTNESESVQIARHEICCTLEDVIKSAAYLLKSGGRFYMVHRAERMTDIFVTLRKYKLEPKKMTWVCAGPETSPSLVLIEAQKDRASGLIVTKPRYVNI